MDKNAKEHDYGDEDPEVTVSVGMVPLEYTFHVGELVRFQNNPNRSINSGGPIRRYHEFRVTAVWQGESSSGTLVNIERTTDGWGGFETGWDASWFRPVDLDDALGVPDWEE